ncbi:MAG: DUF952 domain-containing protein [Rhodobiaceae bacterium]|nr:DUF952 domain-containing protein [Rhodobiaceae bacterium]
MARSETIYKICPAAAWAEAAAKGEFAGHGDDLRDGFIHFSTAEQVEETAARHFAGKSGLVVIAVAAGALGAALKWEPSRGGELFPHLYGVLDPSCISWCRPLPLDAAGRHIFPDLEP